MKKLPVIEKLSIDQLIELRDGIDKRLGDMIASEIEALEERMAKLSKIAKTSAVKSAETKKMIAKKPPTSKRKNKGKKAPAKFIHRESGNSWSGRGLTPVWLREYEADGGKRSDLAV